MQPTFLPWVGYFDLIDQTDKFVFLDDVQLTKRSWQVRNRIKTSNGELYITVPIKKTKHRNELLIKDTEVSISNEWQNNLLSTLKHNYKKSDYFEVVHQEVTDFFSNEFTFLKTLNIGFIKLICQKTGISPVFLESSNLNNISGVKDSRLLSICKETGIDYYISPQGSAQYINEQNCGGVFYQSGVELVYHNYLPIHYKQLYGDFVPYLSILDLVYNHGWDNALNQIRTGRKENILYNKL